MHSTLLDQTVWQQSLIRGPWQADFMPLWQKHIETTSARESMITHMRTTIPNFTQTCIEFIRDLRTFSGNIDSRTRLDSTGHEFFLGKPYFDSATVTTILQLSTVNGTLDTQLRALAEKRKNGEMCAAHDLSPLFERALGISWDKEKRNALSSQHLMNTARISTEGNRLKKLAHKSSKMFTGTFGRKKGGGHGGKGGQSKSSEA